MLDAVILVLREVLEAALFISLLLALGARLALRWPWYALAVPLGLCASWLLSQQAYAIAEAWEGTGQEVVNIALYASAVLCFALLAILVVPYLMRADAAVVRPGSRRRVASIVAFVLIVAGSMAREGSEVWVYLSAFAGAPESLSAALIGGLVGTGIGLSLCVLVYYGLAFLGARAFFLVFFVLASLVAGGLSMQIARLGMQVGWLDSGAALWDTGWLVNERGWFGQFLHALFGYDANPDATQAGFYLATLLLVAAGAALQGYRLRVRTHA